MRIISGKYRGMNLVEFNADNVRPTADRTKESLFNILFSVSGKTALDLFCGSGNIGIECISRGAKFVRFNDSSEKSLAVLNKNLAKLKGETNFSITRMDYAACLKSLQAKQDLIFIDPPYKEEFGRAALQIIAERKLLTCGGVAVYERDKPFEGEISGLEKYDERKYGKAYLTFFRADENQ